MESRYIVRLGETFIQLETLNGNPVDAEARKRVQEGFHELREVTASLDYYDARQRAREEAQREADLWARVGHKIRALRVAKGWSRENLATKAAINCSHIEALEEGEEYKPRYTPQLTTVEQIAAVLSVRMSQLFED